MIDLLGTKKEGPGVYLDTPRKKGIARFFEILFRDFSSFYLSAAISTIAFIPAAIGLSFCVFAANLFWGVVCGIVGGMIASPFYAVLVDTILRAQRDEPGYWWVRYRRAFANNWKASLLPGALFGVLINVLALFTFILLPSNFSTSLIASLLLSVFVTCFLIIWLYPQIVLFKLPFIKLARNAAILSFSQLPRSLAAVIFTLAYWIAAALFAPLSVFVLLLTSVWLPTFIALSFIYVPLNKAFDIETLVEEKRVEDAAKQPRYYSRENDFK